MTAKQIVFLEEASNDLAEGIDFYNKLKPGLGTYFFDSIIADIESLKVSAGAHRIIFGLHRMPAKRLPFSIYYELKGDTAIIFAILDMRRNPAWIRKKLNSRKQ